MVMFEANKHFCQLNPVELRASRHIAREREFALGLPRCMG